MLSAVVSRLKHYYASSSEFKIHSEHDATHGNRLTSCLSLRDRSSCLGIVAPEKGAGFSVIENNRVKFPACLCVRVFFPFLTTCVEIDIVHTASSTHASQIPFRSSFSRDHLATIPNSPVHSIRLATLSSSIMKQTAYSAEDSVKWSYKCKSRRGGFHRAEFTSVRI